MHRDTYEIMVPDATLDIFAQRLREALGGYHLQRVDRIGERVYGVADLDNPAPPYVLATLKTYSEGASPTLLLRLDYVGSSLQDERERWDRLLAGVDLWLSRRYGLALLEAEQYLKEMVSLTASNRAPAYADKDTLSTLVYYMKQHHGKTIQFWCDTIRNVSPRTCRDHKKKGLLLSPEGFADRMDESIEDAANRVLRGEWY